MNKGLHSTGCPHWNNRILLHRASWGLVAEGAGLGTYLPAMHSRRHAHTADNAMVMLALLPCYECFAGHPAVANGLARTV